MQAVRELLRWRTSGRGLPTPAAGVAVLLLLFVAGCGQIPGEAGAVGKQSSPATGGSAAAGSTRCEYTESGDAARPVELPPTANVRATGTATAVMETSAGTITMTLDRERAPCTVNSFLSLAEQGFFDNTDCPRLTDDGIYVLQCGDPTGTTSGGPGYTFPDELSGDEDYLMGTVAMANSGPNSNGSQFFLVYRESEIAADYTVFGEIDAAGINVLNQVAAAGHDGSNPNGGGVPNKRATIRSVTIE